jgi:hypothetical protein
VIDGSETLSGGGLSGPRRTPAETIDRMIQSATYGAQMLESAALQQPPSLSEARSPIDKEPEEPKEVANGTATSSKRQVNNDYSQLVSKLISYRVPSLESR